MFGTKRKYQEKLCHVLTFSQISFPYQEGTYKYDGKAHVIHGNVARLQTLLCVSFQLTHELYKTKECIS